MSDTLEIPLKGPNIRLVVKILAKGKRLSLTLYDNEGNIVQSASGLILKRSIEQVLEQILRGRAKRTEIAAITKRILAWTKSVPAPKNIDDVHDEETMEEDNDVEILTASLPPPRDAPVSPDVTIEVIETPHGNVPTVSGLKTAIDAMTQQLSLMQVPAPKATGAPEVAVKPSETISDTGLKNIFDILNMILRTQHRLLSEMERVQNEMQQIRGQLQVVTRMSVNLSGVLATLKGYKQIFE